MISKYISTLSPAFAALLLLVSVMEAARAQQPLALVSNSDSQPGIRVVLEDEPPPLPRISQHIVAAFVKKESQLRDALNQHTFKRDVILQTIGPNGEVTGHYIRNSQFLFDDKGNRIERVLYHPASTLKVMRITKEDIQDLAGAQLLGIEITETQKYRLDYVGAEKLEGREVFAIDVTPVQTPDPHRMRERFFVGRVWIDANTFQLIKVQGKVEPQGKQRFPLFQTWREIASGDLLLPSRTYADDILRFPQIDVHYRVHVKYYDYKLFASKLTITEIDAPAE
jgi:hypothetical protein